jgi:P27 family predicted phage terminase small subunit
VKERQGTLEKSRTSEQEPRFPDGNKEAPANLTGPSSMEYERLARMLLAQGLFPATAESELAFGCWWYGQWCEAQLNIERYGQVMMTEYGLKPNPAIRIAATAASHYFTMCGRFGLDPASAGKVTARPKDQDADELAAKRRARRAAR